MPSTPSLLFLLMNTTIMTLCLLVNECSPPNSLSKHTRFPVRAMLSLTTALHDEEPLLHPWVRKMLGELKQLMEDVVNDAMRDQNDSMEVETEESSWEWVEGSCGKSGNFFSPDNGKRKAGEEELEGSPSGMMGRDGLCATNNSPGPSSPSVSDDGHSPSTSISGTNSKRSRCELTLVCGPRNTSMEAAFDKKLSQLRSRLEGPSRSWSSTPKSLEEVKNDIMSVFYQAERLPFEGGVGRCCQLLGLPTKGPALLSRLCHSMSSPEITTVSCNAFVSHALFPYVCQLDSLACRTFSSGLAEMSKRRPRVVIESLAIPLLKRQRELVKSSHCELLSRLVKQGNIGQVGQCQRGHCGDP